MREAAVPSPARSCRAIGVPGTQCAAVLASRSGCNARRPVGRQHATESRLCVAFGAIDHPKPPEWGSPNCIRLDLEAMFLRESSEGSPGTVPILIDAPFAGHSSTVADYDKGQSLVETMLSNGAGPPPGDGLEVSIGGDALLQYRYLCGPECGWIESRWRECGNGRATRLASRGRQRLCSGIFILRSDPAGRTRTDSETRASEILVRVVQPNIFTLISAT